jgi:hypothetical protein
MLWLMLYTIASALNATTGCFYLFFFKPYSYFSSFSFNIIAKITPIKSSPPNSKIVYTGIPVLSAITVPDTAIKKAAS